ncbi:hypothetical protein [Anaerococcus hydrogenalis]|uniref:hypothetical protein n=1 Tax=Anaerococcus hydrogenalis TaxID=33029 RepID=UPI0020D2590F|nr:hypothetical protein [Anaerococcus hydrogenalis]
MFKVSTATNFSTTGLSCKTLSTVTSSFFLSSSLFDCIFSSTAFTIASSLDDSKKCRIC